MYNARIEMDDGRTLDLGFDNGIIFDISPLSGIDVDISTSQSYNQIGESVDDMSTFGLTREIFGVIINDENKNSKNILNTLTAFSSGKIYINDRYCEFVTSKTPYIIRSKSGRLTFSAAVFCPYPFWLDSELTEFLFGGVTPTFKFPVIYDSHSFGIRKLIENKNCANYGNVRKSMYIEFSTYSSTTNFGIRNSQNKKYIQISETLSGSDKVYVSQENGKIRIVLKRDNEYSNIISKLVDGSSLFELETGDNVLIPFAESGAENLIAYINFRPAYSGVIV